MCLFFFFNDTATTEIYTLSLHDALPICIYRGDIIPDCETISEVKRYPPFLCIEAKNVEKWELSKLLLGEGELIKGFWKQTVEECDNRSEEHTSELQSHSFISYAVFCLKKKKRIKKKNKKEKKEGC